MLPGWAWDFLQNIKNPTDFNLVLVYNIIKTHQMMA